MKNIKTTFFGIITLAVYIGSYFLPEHKMFFDGVIAVLITGGFISAKDHNVTGGTRRQ